MELTFSYEKKATGLQFLGRRENVASLKQNILEGRHTALCSAPKEGKSSLIDHTLFQMKASCPVALCELQADNVIIPEDFLKTFYAALKAFLPASEGEWKPTEVFSQEECYRLFSAPARLFVPSQRAQKLVIVIREFQRLDSLEGAEVLMRAFRDAFRDTAGTPVVYILTGSQLNAAKELFDKSPFFGSSVHSIRLSPLSEVDIFNYIHSRLDTTGKVMERTDIDAVIRIFGGDNIWYIKHFMALCDSLTRGYVNTPVMREAMWGLISSQLPWFNYIVSNLSCFQLRFLKALIDKGPQCNFSSAAVLRGYALNSSANVARVRQALLKKEIISYEKPRGWYIIDPLFRYWLEKYFFK